MLWVLVCFFGFSFGFFCRSILARYELHKTTVQFKGISADIMKQSNESFMQLASVAFEKYQNKAESAFEKKNEAIEKLIDPVKQSLEKVDQKILELEKARVGAYVSLHQQVESLVSTQKELRSETANLVKALRQPMARGRWGEIQLRRVVEMAGMLEYCDFCQQQSVSTHEGVCARI